VQVGAAVAACSHPHARAAAPSMVAQCGRGGAASAGAERYADTGDARLTSCATWVITSEYGVGGGVDAPCGRLPVPPSTNVVCAVETAQGR